jgi:hypothetical protein
MTFFSKIFISLLLLLLLHLTVEAQLNTENTVIQFSGIVVTGDSLHPIPFANIRIAGTSVGTFCDSRGFFSFVARKGDYIIFSAVGFHTSRFRISDTLTASRYSWIQMLQNDTMLLTETVIYPWPTVQALEFAVLQYRVPENDYDRAMKNMALQEFKERNMELPPDGAMNYRHQMQSIVNKSYYNGQYMPNQLLNPFAWAQFLKAWNDGLFKRKKDDD